MDLLETRERIAAHLVGREEELELALSAVGAGRDLVLEGPPGTSKTTMLKAIANEWGIPLVFVEGNADLTPSRLIGHHNPARVLREDYQADNFVEGPLVEAMRQGGFLYIEELNRAPEDTLNVLLTAMADRQTKIPRVGVVSAAPTFRVIASMNPYDNVGTTRLSTSIQDRMCRISVTYQDAASERGIVALRAEAGPDGTDPLCDGLVADAVAVTRATRAHPSLRQGSSVRGAIDCVLVARQLAALRGIADPDDERYARLVLDAMTVALSGRIYLDEAAEATAEQVLEDIWRDHFGADGATRRSGGEIEIPLPPTQGMKPLSRKPKQLDEEPTVFTPVPGGRGGLRVAGNGRDRREVRPGARGSESGESDEPAALAELPGGERSVDPQARAIAREIAAQLSLPRPRRGSAARRGRGILASLPYRGGADEIDLDRTLEVLTERPVPADEDIVVRDRVGARRSVALLIDMSGSMNGERMRTAAATVGALAAELAADDLAVYGFWSDAAKLHGFGERVVPLRLLDLLLELPAKGLTNVAFPLELAARELAGVPTRDARALLLSDCLHNAGPDPRGPAGRLPRLDVLLDVSGSHDRDLGRDLARRGRGRVKTVRDHRDVAPALQEIFAS